MRELISALPISVLTSDSALLRLRDSRRVLDASEDPAGGWGIQASSSRSCWRQTFLSGAETLDTNSWATCLSRSLELEDCLWSAFIFGVVDFRDFDFLSGECLVPPPVMVLRSDFLFSHISFSSELNWGRLISLTWPTLSHFSIVLSWRFLLARVPLLAGNWV